MSEKEFDPSYLLDLDDGDKDSRKNLLRFIVEEPEPGVQILETPAGKYRREVDDKNVTLSLSLIED